jgi:hypothetical protein
MKYSHSKAMAMFYKIVSTYAIVFTPLLLKSLKQVEKLLLNARHNTIRDLCINMNNHQNAILP